jgi:hypothetical protein
VSPSPRGGELAIAADEGVLTLGADGMLRTAVCPDRRPSFEPGLYVDGLPAASAALAAEDVTAGPDGELLIAEFFRGRVLAVLPDGADRFAVAVGPATARLLRDGRIEVVTSQAAKLTLSLHRGGRTVMQTAAEVDAGVSTVALPAPPAPEVYRVEVAARAADGRLAFDQLRSLAASTIPMRVARHLFRWYAEDYAIDGPRPIRLRRCRGADTTEVTCIARFGKDPERFFQSLTLRDDGLLVYADTANGRFVAEP